MDAFLARKRLWVIAVSVAMALLVVFVALFAVVSTLHFNDIKKDAACYIDLNDDLTFHHPLILTPDGREFLTPGPRGIFLNSGDTLFLACTGSGNRLDLGSHKQELSLTCDGNSLFSAKEDNILKRPFKDFKCVSYPKSRAKGTNNKCSEKYKEIEIGFETSKGFVKVITTCFDDANKDSLYSVYRLMSSIDKQQSKVPRPDGFDDAGFYSGLQAHPNTLYKKTHELSTVSKLLGSDELAKKYIKMNDDEYFMSRGHLTAKADFLYGAQQRATFYFVNVAPQWQIFNKENWNILEQDVRAFASNRDLNLTVYTGTWGHGTLPNADGTQVPLYLYLGRPGAANQLTVPQIYWKVVRHEETNRAIAFVGHNDPYWTGSGKPHETVCEDICDKVDWLHWDKTNVQHGFSYCCHVDDLRNTVSHLPAFAVDELLT